MRRRCVCCKPLFVSQHHQQKSAHARGLRVDQQRRSRRTTTVLIEGGNRYTEEEQNASSAIHHAFGNPLFDQWLHNCASSSGEPLLESGIVRQDWQGAFTSRRRQTRWPLRDGQRRHHFSRCKVGDILFAMWETFRRCVSCKNGASSASAAAKASRVDVRVVGATNPQSWRETCARGKFLEDLYYRPTSSRSKPSLLCANAMRTFRCWLPIFSRSRPPGSATRPSEISAAGDGGFAQLIPGPAKNGPRTGDQPPNAACRLRRPTASSISLENPSADPLQPPTPNRFWSPI